MKVSMAEMFVDDEIRQAAVGVLESKRYIKGPEGKALGQEFAEYCSAKHGIPCNSGTSALILAMKAIGIGPGDEVIVPSHTFIATANAVVHVGGRPVFADIEPETYCISPESIRALVTEKTKAIVPVHIYGQPADMDPINEIAQDHGLKVVEDACQAHGATYKGQSVGALGDIACFSFFPSKNMTVAGDGGISVTNNDEYAETMAMLADQGRMKGKKYEHDLVGYNFRLSEILAAIGRVQLKHLPDWIDARREVAGKYNELLDGLVGTPIVAEGREHVYYVYTVQADDRDGLGEHLKENGISTNIYYPLPLHRQPAMTSLFGATSLPETEAVCQRIISLPMYPTITDEQIRYVVENVKDFAGGQ